MGIRVDIDGYVFEALSYSVREDATPIAAGDASGGVSSFQIEVPLPDPHLPLDGGRTGAALVRKYGPEFLRHRAVTITDTSKGFTVGTVDDVSVDEAANVMTLACLGRDASMAAYNINALPHAGTLGGAFRYYLSLAGVTEGISVDAAVASRPVAYVGWSGELWYHLKSMAAAQRCEIALVSGIITLRPIRTRVARLGRVSGKGRQVGSASLASAVEVYRYKTAALDNEPVYPLPHPTFADQVMTVDAGQTAEFEVELGASVSDIVQPVCVDAVGLEHTGSSVYSVVTNEGRALTAEEWNAWGGNVQVWINPDTTSATVRVTAATWPMARSFSLSAQLYGQNYSTLRLIGSGVSYRQFKELLPTGVPLSEAASDVGVTIDNPFVTTKDQVAHVGLLAARSYARQNPTLSANVVSVNRRGETGEVSMPTYQQVESVLIADIGHAPTEAEAKAYYEARGLHTYGDVEEYYAQTLESEFENQVYGNVAGARVWDEKTRRWYRIREADIAPGGIGVQAENDLIVADMQALYDGKTYAEIQEIFEGMTYRQAEILGMFNG